MQIDSHLVFEPPPSGETPHSKRKSAKESYTDKQLLRDLLEIVTSADFPARL